jgi:5-(carboxyamino)imidazole ribonucleotide mutase
VSKTSLPARLDVLVLLGSISDKAVADQMAPVFADFGVTAHFEVCSAHRDHERLAELVPLAEKRGAGVFIGVAGMAAHLPGVLAALTTRPVIGVPCEGKLDGLDALLAIAQMPPGIPVATVATSGGRNAALLAVQILATADSGLRRKLTAFRRKLQRNNRADSERLRKEMNK